MSKKNTSAATGKASGRADGKRRSTTYPESFTAHIKGIDYDVLDSLLGYAIRRAQISLYSDFYTVIGDSSITPQRFAALVIMGANPGLSQVQIADVMGVARPGATTLVDYWEKQDCVERRATPNDRRAYGIYLTRQGAARLDDLKQRVIGHDRSILSTLSDEEQVTLMRLLAKIYGESNDSANRE